MTRKIAIVGTCPSSCALALELPDDWELWVCSAGNEGYPRVDAWFELHGDLDFSWERGRFAKHIEWVNAQDFPLYAQRLDLFPRAMEFPIEDVCKAFGVSFFTSQPALMMAHAILQNPEAIGLFGLDMAARSEYAGQKPAILHFARVCQERGIKVMAPPESEVLMPPPIYGYCFNSPMGRKLKVRECEVKAQVADMDRQIAALQEKRRHFLGVLDENDWSQQTFTGGLYKDPDMVRLKPRLVKTAEQE